MQFRGWLVLALATALLAACGAKTPAEIEAEKRKADEAWANKVAAAERARQAEEARLVKQEIDAHRSRAQADEARAQAEREQQERERDRLLDIVRSNLEAPQAARFANLRWNASRSALCGEVSMDPVTLAALACIITATPGTAWAGYDSGANVVTIHVLDLVDGPALASSIKDRYERRLAEICE